MDYQRGRKRGWQILLLQCKHRYIFLFRQEMSDRYYSGSYGYSQEPSYPINGSNRAGYTNQSYKAGKQRNSYDIKQSNISQQTIIHRARLYSPDRAQELARNNLRTNQQYGKTKAKKSQVTGKIHEIVDLCEDDRDAGVQEFREVAQAEKKILGMLQEEGQERQMVPNIDLSHFGDAYQDRGTTFGPIRNNQPNNFEVQKIQSRQVTRRQANNEKPTATRQARDNIYKKSAIDDLKTDRNLEEPSSTLPAEIRQIAQQNRHLNDETGRMIEEIERKAMEEIEGLRADKIELMTRLNAEIKAHNEEKRIRARLEQELAKYRGEPSPRRATVDDQQKYYSQPHYRQTKPRSPPQPAPQRQSIPQPQPQRVPPIVQQPLPEPIQSNLATLKNQLHKLQQENNILMRTIRSSQNVNANVRPYERGYEKEELRRQVYQLNELIAQYQSEMRRLRFQAGGEGEGELRALLQQGQRIEQDALRLLNRNELQNSNQFSGVRFPNRRMPTSQDIAEDTNTFKMRLMQAENQYQNRNINSNANLNSRTMLENPMAGRYSSKQNISTEQNRMLEFERILSDLNNAAR